MNLSIHKNIKPPKCWIQDTALNSILFWIQSKFCNSEICDLILNGDPCTPKISYFL